MATKYKQLTLNERFYIETRLKSKDSIKNIAHELNRAPRTIYAELNRNNRGNFENYCAVSAQSMSDVRRSSAEKFNKRSLSNYAFLKFWLKQEWSPEQIANRLKLDMGKARFSYSTLYRHIKWWANIEDDLTKFLARKGKKYRTKRPSEAGCHLIPNRVDIDERPDEVDQKQTIGHWEGDTVKASDGHFVTLVERKSKVFLFMKVKRKTADLVGQAVKKLLKPFQQHVKTITFDNGGEFAQHEKIAKYLECKIYFAKPYRSCQRGLNENSNGLLRRYFPKKTAIYHVTHKTLANIQMRINMRARKTLNYLTPIEVITNQRVTVMSKI